LYVILQIFASVLSPGPKIRRTPIAAPQPVAFLVTSVVTRGGHCPMLAQPSLLADELVAIAQAHGLLVPASFQD